MAQLDIAILQNDTVPVNPDAQTAALQRAAHDAAQASAGLLITPELFMSGYKIPGEVADMAQPVDGRYTQAVSAIAKQAGLAILCGYPERDAAGIFNSAALFDAKGNLVCNHRKLHLSGPYEKEHFITEANSVQVADIAGIKVAPLICYDVEFPETVRAAALAGAELVAVPTALVEQFAFLTRTLIPTRAFENGIFVAYANHAGSEADLSYCGLSTLARPDGSFTQTHGAGEELLIARIDTAEIALARDRLPYLADLRRDLIGNQINIRAYPQHR
ncbi:MAG: carbon-nitrogen hydrolase family protein [Aestuariivirgaceae bacterium]